MVRRRTTMLTSCCWQPQTEFSRANGDAPSAHFGDDASAAIRRPRGSLVNASPLCSARAADLLGIAPMRSWSSHRRSYFSSMSRGLRGGDVRLLNGAVLRDAHLTYEVHGSLARTTNIIRPSSWRLARRPELPHRITLRRLEKSADAAAAVTLTRTKVRRRGRYAWQWPIFQSRGRPWRVRWRRRKQRRKQRGVA